MKDCEDINKDIKDQPEDELPYSLDLKQNPI